MTSSPFKRAYHLLKVFQKNTRYTKMTFLEMWMGIFVSIASYRDPELGATIADCIGKARHPDQLTFGICWQHDDQDDFVPPRGPRFRIIDVPWQNSKGACWARSQIQGLWQGEDYYLQLDSHHRFAEDWDVRLLDLISAAPSAKPIISTYCPAYNPGIPENSDADALLIGFYDFNPDGLPLVRPVSISSRDQDGGDLIRGRFVAAGFLFTIGKFVEDVPYNPALYFLGEEISIMVRAYTHGYDVYHPTEVLGWHFYERSGAAKHWRDNADGPTGGPAILERDRLSRAEVRRLLTDHPIGKYQCGSLRTLAEYEAYAGINFAHLKVQDFTRFFLEPPNPPREDNWPSLVRSWIARLELGATSKLYRSLEKADRCYIRIRDRHGSMLHEITLENRVLASLVELSSDEIVVDISFACEAFPRDWSLYFWNDSLKLMREIRGRFHQVAGNENEHLNRLTGYTIPP